jgi:hypothetical protein
VCNIIAGSMAYVALSRYANLDDLEGLGFFTWVVDVTRAHPFIFLIFVFNVFHMIWFLALTLSQSWFVLFNVTTNEVMNWNRYSYLGGYSFRGVGHSNVFDLGFVANCSQFWRLPGSKQIDWAHAQVPSEDVVEHV